MMFQKTYSTLAISAALLFSAFGVANAQDFAGDPTGLVSWWSGNGNALDPVSGNDGTAHSGVEYVKAVYGQGFKFDGGDMGINIPDKDSLKLTGSMTISAWINVESFPGQAGMILFRGDDRSGLDPYHLSVNSLGQAGFHIESLTNSSSVVEPVPLHTWTLVTATLDADAGIQRIYENGLLYDERHTKVLPFRDLDPASNPSLGIGHHGGFPKSPHHFGFHGSIDDLRLYARALGRDEIVWLYQAGMARLAEPPQAVVLPIEKK